MTKPAFLGWCTAGLAFVLAMCRCACAQSAPATQDQPADPPAALVSEKFPVRVWVDQIGYRTSGRKIAIVASDVPLPADIAIDICDVQNAQKVWSLAGKKPFTLRSIPKGIRDKETGEFVAQLDFSDLRAPGRYYIVYDCGAARLRSYQFNIADEVYKDAALASWKAFFYQRADFEKAEEFAGPWNHKLDHHGPNQATSARVYEWEGGQWNAPVGQHIIDPTPRDVTGGWWDSGNFNKHIASTVQVNNALLLAIQLFGDVAKDNQLNIPESGNRIPDVYDEARYGTEFLIRLAEADGAAFGRVYEGASCPPDADASPVQLTASNSMATMERACALAYAALVWKQSKLDDRFAKRCLEESTKSWKLLEARPHPWPAEAPKMPKNPRLPAPKLPAKPVKPKLQCQGEWWSMDFNVCKALTAACYFAMTGEKQYDDIVHELAADFKPFLGGENVDLFPLIWVYAHAAGADPALVASMKDPLMKGADWLALFSGPRRGYGAGLRYYHWGSNRLIASSGVNLILASQFAQDEAARQRYLDAAEEYVHYLFGRNPLGLCYLSNMKQFGAENSVMVMYHQWVGNASCPEGAKYIGQGDGKIGPFPGMLVGGPKGAISQYVNILGDRCWEYNEPVITYQAQCATLLGYFGLKVK